MTKIGKQINERGGAQYIYVKRCECEGTSVIVHHVSNAVKCAECGVPMKQDLLVDTGERIHKVNSPR